MQEQLQRIESPRTCWVEECPNLAFWQDAEERAICYECMEIMTAMNSDNAAYFAHALAHKAQEGTV